MNWETWRSEVQQRSGMTDQRMHEVEDDARKAFQAGITSSTYADMSD